jgi:hypothetical protein
MPIEQTRGPLEGRLRDSSPEVRLSAAVRLVAAPPPVSPAALETLGRDLCHARIMTALRVFWDPPDGPRPLPASAAPAFAQGLKAPEAGCRLATAVLLAQLDPERGVSVLPSLREALRLEAEEVRRAAARALARMGCAARGELAALESAAEKDRELARSLEELRDAVRPGPQVSAHFAHQGLAMCPLADLALVATVYATAPGGPAQAFVRVADKRVSGVEAGTRFLDGEVVAVEPGVLVVRERHVGEDLALVESTRRIALFADELAPAASAGGGDVLMDIDFDGEIAPFLSLVARDFANVMLAPDTQGTVRLAARRATPAALLAQGLEAGGFSSQSYGSLAVIGSRGAPILSPPHTDSPGEPITIHLEAAALADVMKMFAQVSGLDIVLSAPGGRAPVTMFVDNVPWTEVLEAIIAARGWTYHLEGNRFEITAAGD